MIFLWQDIKMIVLWQDIKMIVLWQDIKMIILWQDIKMDTYVEMRNGGRHSSTNLRKDEDITSSQSSLGSNMSRAVTPCHSRQNSRASLLDIIDPHRRSSTGNGKIL